MSGSLTPAIFINVFKFCIFETRTSDHHLAPITQHHHLHIILALLLRPNRQAKTQFNSLNLQGSKISGSDTAVHTTSLPSHRQSSELASPTMSAYTRYSGPSDYFTDDRRKCEVEGCYRKNGFRRLDGIRKVYSRYCDDRTFSPWWPFKLRPLTLY
jgi:hypothetical protein